MDKLSVRFIDKLYRDLYKSSEVMHHAKGNATEKFKNISGYMDKLEDIHRKAVKKKNLYNLLKKMYHNKYVIKREDIPDSYYELQKKIALERGYGHITIDEKTKRELQNVVIEDQKNSLNFWIDYLLGEDTAHYPFWALYWAFQGMVKIGSCENGMYKKRTKETVTPFMDLNQEALAISIELIIDYVNKKKINEREFDSIVSSGSFQKIYTHILEKITSQQKEKCDSNDGIWVKYERNSPADILSDSLQGYNTGWCTAGVNTATRQLNQGDFYVYYTLDNNGEYKVPRIAIRMEGNKIAEIRGVAYQQNLESDMEYVVEEKLKEFEDGEFYKKKVSDMKRLTTIYDKVNEDNKLTVGDLRFLYELDSKISGFGYKRDPRISEILSKRDKREDLAKCLGCEKSQIALCCSDINEDCIYYLGDLKFNKNIVYKKMPKYVEGSVHIDCNISSDVTFPERIMGGLTVTKAECINGDTVLPKFVGGNIEFRTLTSIEDVTLPEEVLGSLYLNSVRSVKNVKFPEHVDEIHLERLVESTTDLMFGKHLSDSIVMDRLVSNVRVTFPKIMKGYIKMWNYSYAEGLTLPEKLGDSLVLPGIKNADNLVLPKSVGHIVNLSGAESAKGLVLPEQVGGGIVYLDSLESLDDVIMPENFTYSIKLKDFIVIPDIYDNIGSYTYKKLTKKKNAYNILK